MTVLCTQLAFPALTSWTVVPPEGNWNGWKVDTFNTPPVVVCV